MANTNFNEISISRKSVHKATNVTSKLFCTGVVDSKIHFVISYSTGTSTLQWFKAQLANSHQELLSVEFNFDYQYSRQSKSKM